MISFDLEIYGKSKKGLNKGLKSYLMTKQSLLDHRKIGTESTQVAHILLFLKIATFISLFQHVKVAKAQSDHISCSISRLRPQISTQRISSSWLQYLFAYFKSHLSTKLVTTVHFTICMYFIILAPFLSSMPTRTLPAFCVLIRFFAHCLFVASFAEWFARHFPDNWHVETRPFIWHFASKKIVLVKLIQLIALTFNFC